MERLTSTEKTTVDLIALRAWHWKASMDPEREPEIRRWHRQQVKHISLRISRRGEALTDAEALPLVEMLTEANTEELYLNVAKAYAGDWTKLCELTREAILRKLERNPGFGPYHGGPQPCDCRSTSSGCDIGGKGAADSQPDAAPNKIESSEAKASGDALRPEE